MHHARIVSQICKYLTAMLVSTASWANSWIEPPKDIPDSPFAWNVQKLLIWEELDLKDPRFDQSFREQILIVYQDRLQTPEHRYLAASAYASQLQFIGHWPYLRSLCQEFPPRADDYSYQSQCLYVAELDEATRTKQLFALAERSYQAAPHQLVAFNIFSILGHYLTDRNRTTEGIYAYKRAIEILPVKAGKEFINTKMLLAFAYTNPVYGERLKRQALVYYQEVIDWHKQQNENSALSFAMMTTYNLGIAHLFLFEEYEPAIAAFKEALNDYDLGLDARVFLAFTYAQSGQKTAAQELLPTIDLSQKLDPARLAFLTCYRDLTRYLTGERLSLKSCIELEDPQADVLMHLTETLSRLELPTEEENKWWRMFYRNFSKVLLPDIQRNLESASYEAELSKEQTSGRLKDLELQNLSLYQNLNLAFAGLLVAFGLLFFLSLRSRRSTQRYAQMMSVERARLRHILDSIEESIFLIKDDLTMQAEESPHHQNILGRDIPNQTQLKEFLSLTQLSADEQATMIASLQACFHEDSLCWELNHSQLPAEAKIQDRYLALFWLPVFTDDKLSTLFLAIRNNTDLKQLELANRVAWENADKNFVYLRQILRAHGPSVRSFLGSLPELICDITHEIQQKNFASVIRFIHTLKGSARSLGLVELRDIAHHLEHELQGGKAESIAEHFVKMQQICHGYQQALAYVNEEGQSAQIPTLTRLVADLQSSLQEQLNPHHLQLDSLQVVEKTRLSADEYEALRTILLHGMTNALDHGFILRLQDFPVRPSIRLSIELESDITTRHLRIYDNGAGIDVAKLKKLAAERSWSPQAGESWSAILFQDGVTTTANLSLTSGRGVGLAAIKQCVENLSGEFALLDNPRERGALLTLSWPNPHDLQGKKAIA